MIYYTINSLPHPMKRVTTYSILKGKSAIYRATFKGTAEATDVGKPLSRFTVYTLPHTLAFGSYVFRAVLTISSRHQTKIWKFTIGRRERAATTRNPS